MNSYYYCTSEEGSLIVGDETSRLKAEFGQKIGVSTV